MLNIEEFNGTLPVRYIITCKLDGVQAIIDPVKEIATSRVGTVLHNLELVIEKLRIAGITEALPFEVYLGAFEASQSAVMTHIGTPVTCEQVYDLSLQTKGVIQPPPILKEIDLQAALDLGYEGLMIHDLDRRVILRWKPFKTMDVKILGVLEGCGRNTGRLGSLVTQYGNVGTGFDDFTREQLWKEKPIGRIAEIKYQRMTYLGNFRHPVFLRFRPDKEN